MYVHKVTISSVKVSKLKTMTHPFFDGVLCLCICLRKNMWRKFNQITRISIVTLRGIICTTFHYNQLTKNIFNLYYWINGFQLFHRSRHICYIEDTSFSEPNKILKSTRKSHGQKLVRYVFGCSTSNHRYIIFFCI